FAVETSSEVVGCRYLHPQLHLGSSVRAEGGGNWRYRDGKLSAELHIDRQAEVEIRLHVRAIDQEDPISDEQAERREQHLAAWQSRIAEVEAPGDSPLAAIANRSMQDIGSLALLEGPEEEWLVPAAGIPLFQACWFRDSLTSAWQASIFD